MREARRPEARCGKDSMTGRAPMKCAFVSTDGWSLLLVGAVLACAGMLSGCGKKEPTGSSEVVPSAEPVHAGPGFGMIRPTFISSEPPSGDYAYEVELEQPVEFDFGHRWDDEAMQGRGLGWGWQGKREVSISVNWDGQLKVEARHGYVGGMSGSTAYQSNAVYDSMRLVELVEADMPLQAGETVLWRAELLRGDEVVKTLTYLVAVPAARVEFGLGPLGEDNWTAEQRAYASQVGVVFAGQGAGAVNVAPPGPLNVIFTNHGDRVIAGLGGLVRWGGSQRERPGAEVVLPRFLQPGEQAVVEIPDWEKFQKAGSPSKNLVFELRELAVM